MKHTISLFLLVAMVLLPTAPVFALETKSADIVTLEAQLKAVNAYLTQLKDTSPKQPLSHDKMRAVILAGTAWLVTAQEDSGHFRYEYVPYEGAYLKDDNIVRQGGALFALGEVYRRQEKKDARIEKAIIRAADFFENISIEGTENGKTFRCVANSEESSTCKLGATALVLTGILGYIEGKPSASQKYRKLVDDYTAYIIASQKTEGGFRHEYRTRKGFGDEESPFSNGEALLALVRVYQLKADTKVQRSIDSAFSYLKVKEYDSSLYLWIMAALNDMQKLWPNDEYVTYVRNFTVWRMARAPYALDRNYCAYAEGVASAYSVLSVAPLSGELANLRTKLDALNTYHATLQIGTDDTYRVVGAASGGLSLGMLAEPKLAAGGFLTANSNATQRIDFTQHCVSTYAQTLVEIDGQSL